MEEEISIISLNINGLRDRLKRRAIFKKLNKNKRSIVFLQETHSVEEVENRWKLEWGNKNIYFGHGTTNSRGVIICVTEDIDFELINMECDSEGRLLIIEAKIEKHNWLLINVYVPTQNFEKQQIAFLNKVQDLIQKYNIENIIIGGDLNVHLDKRKDVSRKESNITDNPKFRSELLAIMEAEELVDIMRMKNPDKRLFTWQRGELLTRLDYFFISSHLCNKNIECEIINEALSDHRAIKIKFNCNRGRNKGKGFWKLNVSLLENKDYVKLIKKK